MFVLLWPGLGAMAGPVTAYGMVITAMVWRGLVRIGRTERGPLAEWLGSAGVILFAVSDALIAIGRYYLATPSPGLGFVVILLYWLGQAGITASVVVFGERSAG